MPLLLAQIVLPLLGLLWITLILFALPGTWLAIASAALCEWATEGQLFHWGTFAAAVVLALAGELWELLASATRARNAGASGRGALGALVGGISGGILGTLLIPVPLVGTLVGGGLGAFVGATLIERHGGRRLDDAVRIGQAAGVGHVLGLAGKLALGVAVWLVFTVAVLVP